MNRVRNCETGEEYVANSSVTDIRAFNLLKQIRPRSFDEQMAILRGAENDA